ncbi:hypothetical protein K1719_009399 [Acacia pycnantha]|nr:hypothetical protein K1719_009399 [Acacia pycnantha]
MKEKAKPHVTPNPHTPNYSTHLYHLGYELINDPLHRIVWFGVCPITLPFTPAILFVLSADPRPPRSPIPKHNQPFLQ